MRSGVFFCFLILPPGSGSEDIQRKWMVLILISTGQLFSDFLDIKTFAHEHTQAHDAFGRYDSSNDNKAADRVRNARYDFSTERQPARMAGNWKHVETQRAKRMGGKRERQIEGEKESERQRGKKN